MAKVRGKDVGSPMKQWLSREFVHVIFTYSSKRRDEQTMSILGSVIRLWCSRTRWSQCGSDLQSIVCFSVQIFPTGPLMSVWLLQILEPTHPSEPMVPL